MQTSNRQNKNQTGNPRVNRPRTIKKNKSGSQASVILLKNIMKILVIALLAITLVKITTFAYEEAYKIFNDRPNVTGEKVEYSIDVKKGMTVKAVGEVLFVNGIISDELTFSVQAKLSGLSKTMKTGVHKVDSYMSTREIIQNLSTEGEKKSER